MIVIDCTFCGKKIRIEDVAARSGATQCPKCGGMVGIHAGNQDSTFSEDAPLPTNQSATPGEVRHKRPGRRSVNVLAIASLCIGITGILVMPVGFWALMGGRVLGERGLGVTIVLALIGIPLSTVGIILSIVARRGVKRRVLPGERIAALGRTTCKIWLLFALFQAFAVVWLEVQTRPHSDARAAVCKSNLKQIGLALHMYADDDGGYFPTIGVPGANSRGSISLLYNKYNPNPKLFICPATSTLDVPSMSAPGPSFFLAENEISYHYVNGLTTDTSSNMPIAWEKKSLHQSEGRNILYVGGHVTWCPESSFEEELAIHGMSYP